MQFAHLKTHQRFERMRLRDLSSARDRPEPQNHGDATDKATTTNAARLMGAEEQEGSEKRGPAQKKLSL